MKLNKFIAVVIAFVMIFALMPVLEASAEEHFSVPLMVDDMEVGEVIVTNDSDYMYVEYVLNQETLDEGWRLKKLQLHITKYWKDYAPYMNKGEAYGEHSYMKCFTLEEDMPRHMFEICLPEDHPCAYRIAAHAILVRADCLECEAPYTGYEVVDFMQGTKLNNVPIKTERSNPLAVLDYEMEEDKDETDFFSLGFNVVECEEKPFIIVEFECPILNCCGNDLKVVEDTWGLPYPTESALVSVSENGEDWIELGVADNQSPMDSQHTVTEFDLPEYMECANFVMVEEVTDIDGFEDNLEADGFDLNSIVALHDFECCEMECVSAWAMGEEFCERGNWGMHFIYELTEILEPIETLMVSSLDGVGVESTTVLEDGKVYAIKARGTFTYNSNEDWADAEYYQKNGEVVKGDIEGSEPYVLDVSIDGYDINYDWGEFNPDHEYMMYMMGQGSTIEFSIYDSFYGDNCGCIEVEICEVVCLDPYCEVVCPCHHRMMGKAGPVEVEEAEEVAEEVEEAEEVEAPEEFEPDESVEVDESIDTEEAEIEVEVEKTKDARIPKGKAKGKE